MRHLWALLVLVGCLGRDDDDVDRDPCAVVLPCHSSATITAHTMLTADRLEGATVTVCEGSGKCSSVVFTAACPNGQCELVGEINAIVSVSGPGELRFSASPGQTRMDETWSVEVTDAMTTTLFASSAIGSYVDDVYPCGTCRVLTLELQ